MGHSAHPTSPVSSIGNLLYNFTFARYTSLPLTPKNKRLTDIRPDSWGARGEQELDLLEAFREWVFLLIKEVA